MFVSAILYNVLCSDDEEDDDEEEEDEEEEVGEGDEPIMDMSNEEVG